MGLASAKDAHAIPVDLTVVDTGLTVGTDTRLYRADLSTIPGGGFVSALTLTDDGTTMTGAPGIFSGFDLDAVFLDVDGDPGTTSDQFLPTGFSYTAGSVRFSALAIQQPTASHPGPLFGSLDASTVDEPTATLDSFDAVSTADVTVADGFLTLGDDGILVVNFANVPIGDSLFLLLGEVGVIDQSDENIFASAEVTPVPLPGAMWLFLTGLMALIGFSRRRRIATAPAPE